jgi:hypothetical protein
MPTDSPGASANQTYNQQERRRSNRRLKDQPSDPAKQMNAKAREQPIGYLRANNADCGVAD